MNVQDFEKNLQELLKNAPKGSTIFFCYTNEFSNGEFQMMQGKAINLIADLSRMVVDSKDVRKILSTVMEPGIQSIAKNLFKNDTGKEN